MAIGPVVISTVAHSKAYSTVPGPVDVAGAYDDSLTLEQPPVPKISTKSRIITGVTSQNTSGYTHITMAAATWIVIRSTTASIIRLRVEST